MKHGYLVALGLIASCGTSSNSDIYNRAWRFSPESATIDPTQSNGASWDPDNSPPDAYVRMYFATFDTEGNETDDEVGTSPQDESYSPVWTFSADSIVFAGNTLSIDLIDSDVLDDDTVVSCDVDLTPAIAGAGEASCNNDQGEVHIGIDVL